MGVLANTGNELRPIWKNIFSFNWKFGLFLTFAICISRFILVLHANTTGNYSFIGLVMLVSAIIPFVFLNKPGRLSIGLTKPAKYKWLLIAFAAGLVASMLIYVLGHTLYGNSYENWYSYIGKSYKIPNGIKSADKFTLFLIMALVGMIFSPIGEELFFRGIVHTSFRNSIGDKKASVADGAAFAITHLSHFGIVFINNKWIFFTIPAIIWVCSMFLVSMLFYVCKKYSGSILGAILGHAGFNLGMIYSIFYLL
jgi:uncharacterized protein